MNRMLWRKGFRDCWVQLVISAALLVLFGWVFVWLISHFQPEALMAFLEQVSRFFQPLVGKSLDKLVGVELHKLATPTGRLSILYSHVITMVVCLGWAVGRGSDVVSGEISRGTMDLLLSLPVRRAEVMAVSAIVAALGAVVLALSLWAGSCIGVATVTLPGKVAPVSLLPGVANLAAMTFCLTGVTAMFSSWDRNRWRTICLAGGLFAVSFILKMVGLLWPRGAWIKYLSFLTAYEPQKLVLSEPGLAWGYSGTLVGIGLAGYLVAAVVFSWRDIPVPH